MIDMIAEGRQLDSRAITRLQALKTGRLIQFSAEAGAILGRAPLAQRHQLRGLWARSRRRVPDRRRSARRRGHDRGDRQDRRQGRGGRQGDLGLDPGSERARAQAAMLAEQAARRIWTASAHAAGRLRQLACLRGRAAVIDPGEPRFAA